MINNINSPFDKAQNNIDYSIFRENILPDYDEECFKAGGRIILKLPNIGMKNEQKLFDTWLHLLLALIGKKQTAKQSDTTNDQNIQIRIRPPPTTQSATAKTTPYSTISNVEAHQTISQHWLAIDRACVLLYMTTGYLCAISGENFEEVNGDAVGGLRLVCKRGSVKLEVWTTSKDAVKMEALTRNVAALIAPFGDASSRGGAEFEVRV